VCIQENLLILMMVCKIYKLYKTIINFDSEVADNIDPTYIVNFENGRGVKLNPILDNPLSNLKGHIAHYVNSIHPAHLFPVKNVKLSLSDKIATDKYGNRKRSFSVGDIGFFRLKALRDIQCGEELITDYGFGYWNTMLKWQQRQSSTQIPTEREQRMRRRLERRRLEA